MVEQNSCICAMNIRHITVCLRDGTSHTPRRSDSWSMRPHGDSYEERSQHEKEGE
jgi:hypothetical protein